jgi:hypothetical protein
LFPSLSLNRFWQNLIAFVAAAIVPSARQYLILITPQLAVYHHPAPQIQFGQLLPADPTAP